MHAVCAGRQGLVLPLPLPPLCAGNAWTDPTIDNPGAVEFWWSHGMISFDVREGIDANCDYSSVGPLAGGVGAGQRVTLGSWGSLLSLSEALCLSLSLFL